MKKINHIQAGEARFVKQADDYEVFMSFPKIKASLMLLDPTTGESDYMWTGLDDGTAQDIIDKSL